METAAGGAPGSWLARALLSGEARGNRSQVANTPRALRLTSPLFPPAPRSQHTELRGLRQRVRSSVLRSAGLPSYRAISAHITTVGEKAEDRFIISQPNTRRALNKKQKKCLRVALLEALQ